MPDTVTLSRPEYAELLVGLLQEGLPCRVPIRGRSMEPLIRDGEVVTVSPDLSSPLRPGEIVVVQAESGELLCHRLVTVGGGRQGTWVQTWGDAALLPDLPLPGSAVLGRVVAVGPLDREIRGAALLRGFRRVLLRRRLLLRFPCLRRWRERRFRRQSTSGANDLLPP